MPGIQHLHEARHGHAALISELARAALAEAAVEPDEITACCRWTWSGLLHRDQVALAAAGILLATAAAERACHISRQRRSARLPGLMADISLPPRTKAWQLFAQLFTATTDPLSEIVEIDPEDDKSLADAGTAQW